MIKRLLPRAENHYSGSRWSLGFLTLATVMSTARSLIHLLAPDGGAHTIAGITLDVAGGPNIVALFGQWGASQLVLACLQWVVVLRYRFLVPAMLAIIVLEQLLRILAGRLKPLILDSPPPGAYGTYVVLGLALIFLAIELRHHPRS
jgi:hypothetical protein